MNACLHHALLQIFLVGSLESLHKALITTYNNMMVLVVSDRPKEVGHEAVGALAVMVRGSSDEHSGGALRCVRPAVSLQDGLVHDVVALGVAW